MPNLNNTYCKILLNFNGTDASTTFTNSSLYLHTFTANGNAQIDTSDYKFGGASGLFDGTGDYLTCSTNPTDWAFGTGDFTIAGWIKFTSLSNSVFYLSDYGGNSFGLRIYSSKLTISTSSGALLTGSTTLSTGTWYHVAFVRYSGSLKIFLDGILDGSVSDSTDITNLVDNTLYIGGDPVSTTTYLNGWMDDWIILKGSALYTSNFTPPTTEYSLSPYGIDGYTKLMLHMDGTDASTTFTDEMGHTWTASGNAQIDTAQYKFSTASGLFDGAGDYISAPDSEDWNLGSNNFQIDMWVRFNSLASNISPLFMGRVNWNTVAGDWMFYYRGISTDDRLEFFYTTDGTISTVHRAYGAWTPSLNTWYHIEVSRSGTSIYLFVDGTQIGSTYTAGTDVIWSSSTQAMRIGISTDSDNTTAMNGWIDEVHFENGIAGHTSNFNPPTIPYALENSATFNLNFPVPTVEIIASLRILDIYFPIFDFNFIGSNSGVFDLLFPSPDFSFSGTTSYPGRFNIHIPAPSSSFRSGGILDITFPEFTISNLRGYNSPKGTLHIHFPIIDISLSNLNGSILLSLLMGHPILKVYSIWCFPSLI